MTPQEAFQVARQFATDVYGSGLKSDIRLEELQKDTRGNWIITVSWVDTTSTPTQLGALGGIFKDNLPREYKVFEVDQLAKEVKSMKIWKNDK